MTALPRTPEAATKPPGAPVESLVSEFLEEKRQEVAAEEARAKKKRSPVAAGVLGVLAAAIWFVPIPTNESDPFADTVATGRAAQLGLEMLGRRVSSYAQAHGRLPTSLTEAGIVDSIQYLPGANGAFALRTSIAGRTYSYATAQTR